MIGFLLDQHLPKWWKASIARLQPTVTAWRINDGIAPPEHSHDTVLLDWCESYDANLLTNNRSTMPGHLADHVAAGRHVPGIFIVHAQLDITILANSLAYIAGVMFPDEFQDQIVYPPLIPP
jgi:hypothetical protein